QALAILPGEHATPVQALLAGEDIGTLVAGAIKKRISARKKWLLYARPEGEICIDSGAEDALVKRGSSLLPGGIRKLSGSFLSGDPVDIVTLEGRIIGRGISNYSFRDLSHSSSKLHGPQEVIHRDNLI